MTISSTKNLSRNDRGLRRFLSPFVLTLWGLLTTLFSAWAEPTHETRARIDGRVGYHLFDPRDLATHRYTLNIEEKVALPPHWGIGFSGRAYAEAAFATNRDRYAATPVVRDDSQEIVLRDLYAEYRNDWLTARVGNQQVAWGETFGFYYADIVNPKDLRELGIGDLAANRLPVPMVNLKAILGDYSLQLLYIPKPYFNRIPSPGSDFAYPYQNLVPGASFAIADDGTLPLALSNGELGARVTALLGGIDLSLFSLYYFDRSPTFQPRVTSVTPMSIQLDARHPRVLSFGTTATADLAPFVVRLEGVHTLNRGYDSFPGGVYASGEGNELAGVVELDYQGIADWNFGLQLSTKHVTELITDALVPRDRQQLGFHVSGTTWRDQRLDVIYAYAPNDGGTLLEADYTVPLTSALEASLRADLFLGQESSELGRYRRASRVYGLLRAYFSTL